MILETVQAEGGINVATVSWLRRLEEICRALGILVILDDIQVGCGRTGPFFSFERAGIVPDLICLSKSLSGFGLPLSVVLIRPDLDVWEPGEHNGTFRGHNPAFVTARATLEEYWQSDALSRRVETASAMVQGRLETIVATNPWLGAQVRGLGLIPGLAFGEAKLAAQICRRAFDRGLVMETAGPEGEVAKVMPPLTIDELLLKQGLEILEAAVQEIGREMVAQEEDAGWSPSSR